MQRGRCGRPEGHQGEGRVLSPGWRRGKDENCQAGGLGKEPKCFMSAQRLTGQPRAIKAEAVEAHGSGGGPQSPGEHE